MLDSAHDRQPPTKSKQQPLPVADDPASSPGAGPTTPDALPAPRPSLADDAAKELVFPSSASETSCCSDQREDQPLQELQQENAALRQLLLDHKQALYTAQRAQADLWLCNRQLAGAVTWLQKEAAVRGTMHDALFEEVMLMRRQDSQALHAELQAMCAPSGVLVVAPS